MVIASAAQLKLAAGKPEKTTGGRLTGLGTRPAVVRVLVVNALNSHVPPLPGMLPILRGLRVVKIKVSTALAATRTPKLRANGEIFTAANQSPARCSAAMPPTTHPLFLLIPGSSRPPHSTGGQALRLKMPTPPGGICVMKVAILLLLLLHDRNVASPSIYQVGCYHVIWSPVLATWYCWLCFSNSCRSPKHRVPLEHRPRLFLSSLLPPGLIARIWCPAQTFQSAISH